MFENKLILRGTVHLEIYRKKRETFTLAVIV